MVDSHTGGSEEALIQLPLEWRAQDDLKGVYKEGGLPWQGG